MSSLRIVSLEIKDCFLVYGERFSDSRGFFEELYNEAKFERPIAGERWKQVSMAQSKSGVLRGLHCSNYAKYVTCVSGQVYDVVVDLRPDSPTYLKWQGVWLSGEESAHLFVPKRCGHGYMCERDSLFLYLQDGTYNPQEDIEVNPFDEQLAVNWPKPTSSSSGSDYIVSAKDRASVHLNQIEKLINEKKLPVHYSEIIKSEITKSLPQPWLVYGSRGFLGEYLVRILEKRQVIILLYCYIAI